LCLVIRVTENQRHARGWRRGVPDPGHGWSRFPLSTGVGIGAVSDPISDSAPRVVSDPIPSSASYSIGSSVSGSASVSVSSSASGSASGVAKAKVPLAVRVFECSTWGAIAQRRGERLHSVRKSGADVSLSTRPSHQAGEPSPSGARGAATRPYVPCLPSSPRW